mmetsp:Transcript_56750/g.161096  ORF Transcript_56750/g.161096 Transcript_56750/m.161096 type:complete len:437 (-) Transcript_56750:28-1338(-)
MKFKCRSLCCAGASATAPTAALAAHPLRLEVPVVVPPAVALVLVVVGVPAASVSIAVLRPVVGVPAGRRLRAVAAAAPAAHGVGLEVAIVVLAAVVAVAVVLGVPGAGVPVIVLCAIVGVRALAGCVPGEVGRDALQEALRCCHGDDAGLLARLATGAPEAEGVHAHDLDTRLVVPHLEPRAPAVAPAGGRARGGPAAGTDDPILEVAMRPLQRPRVVQLAAGVALVVSAEATEPHPLAHLRHDRVQNDLLAVAVIPAEREDRHVQRRVEVDLLHALPRVRLGGYHHLHAAGLCAAIGAVLRGDNLVPRHDACADAPAGPDVGDEVTPLMPLRQGDLLTVGDLRNRGGHLRLREVARATRAQGRGRRCEDEERKGRGRACAARPAPPRRLGQRLLLDELLALHVERNLLRGACLHGGGSQFRARGLESRRCTSCAS